MKKSPPAMVGLFLGLLLLTACDFTVPLSPSPRMMVDKPALGLWQRTTSRGNTERLLVLQLGEREYLIVWPKGANTELYARAHLFEYAGSTLVQLQWFGNSNGDVPDDDRNYQIASYGISADRLSVRLLNTDVIGKEFSTADDLAAAIDSNSNDPELFGEEMLFHRSGNGSDA